MGIKGQLLVRGVDQWNGEVEFANANLLKKPNGYYLKVTAYIDKGKEKKQKKNGKEIGLDFGVKTAITTSEGEKIEVQVRESDQLKKLQKEMFRRQKGSNNRRQTIKKINKAY